MENNIGEFDFSRIPDEDWEESYRYVEDQEEAERLGLAKSEYGMDAYDKLEFIADEVEGRLDAIHQLVVDLVRSGHQYKVVANLLGLSVGEVKRVWRSYLKKVVSSVEQVAEVSCGGVLTESIIEEVVDLVLRKVQREQKLRSDEFESWEESRRQSVTYAEKEREILKDVLMDTFPRWLALQVYRGKKTLDDAIKESGREIDAEIRLFIEKLIKLTTLTKTKTMKEVGE